MTNGTSIHRLTLGVFPDCLRRQLATARKYRAELEQFVLDAKGEVSVVDSHYIDQAAGAEVHSAICRMLMRTKWEQMSVSDIALCSKEIMKSKAIRNAAIEKLQLDRQQTNLIDALYARVDDEPDDDDATLPDSTPVAIADELTTDEPAEPNTAAAGECRIPDQSPENE